MRRDTRRPTCRQPSSERGAPRRAAACHARWPARRGRDGGAAGGRHRQRHRPRECQRRRRGEARTPTATPSSVAATPTPGASTGSACAASDVVLTAEPWGGAAGSRGTVVTVTLADGAAPCDVATGPRGRRSTVPGRSSSSRTVAVGGTTRLEAGASYTVGVAWSNWCDPAPAGPVGLELQLDGSSWMPVPPSGGADPVPPCMGSDPTSLSTTELQAVQ